MGELSQALRNSAEYGVVKSKMRQITAYHVCDRMSLRFITKLLQGVTIFPA